MLDPTPPNSKRASLHLGRFHSLSQKRKATREQIRKPKNAQRFQAIPENRYSSAMTRSWEEEAAAVESDWDGMASSSLSWLSMSLNLVVATFVMRTNFGKGTIRLGFSTNSFFHGEDSKNVSDSEVSRTCGSSQSPHPQDLEGGALLAPPRHHVSLSCCSRRERRKPAARA
ncbi:hypothetical protein BHE74_00049213 [Ensete ventricosum]|nr:hypothetical protein BHE74_00049213 [Ensete ventricosum]